MNNQRLILILVLLLGVYGASRLFSDKKDSSFNKNIIQIDTTLVTSIVMNTKADQHQEVRLQKEGGNWLITKGDFTTVANAGSVNGMLSSMELVRAKRVVAKKEDKWATYEIQEQVGNRIRVYQKGTLLEDFTVGRFQFNQQTRSGTSYIRLTDQKEVYAVDGFLSMNFGQSFDAFRDKQIAKLNVADIRSLQYDAPNVDTRIFTKKETVWVLGETPLDSTQITSLINGMTNVVGSEFVNDFDEQKATSLLHQKVTIIANNQIDPLVVSCYKDAARAKPYVLHSSANPDSYFASDSTGIYQQLFGAASAF